MKIQSILFIALICLQNKVIKCQRRSNNVSNKERGMPTRVPHRKQVIVEESFAKPCMSKVAYEQEHMPVNYANQPMIYQPRYQASQNVIEAYPRLMEFQHVMPNVPVSNIPRQMPMISVPETRSAPAAVSQQPAPHQVPIAPQVPAAQPLQMAPQLPVQQCPLASQLPVSHQCPMTPQLPVVPQLLEMPKCMHCQMPLAPIQQETLKIPVPYPVPVAMPETRVPETRMPETYQSPIALVSPFLPAASPVSAWAPPTSNLLPPISTSQTRSHFLRKIPIPPPTL